MVTISNAVRNMGQLLYFVYMLHMLVSDPSLLCMELHCTCVAEGGSLFD